MGKEQLTIEVDSVLMEALRKAGIDPQNYVERILRRNAVARETDAERQVRNAALRSEMAPGIAAYERWFDEVGDWSADLRVF